LAADATKQVTESEIIDARGAREVVKDDLDDYSFQKFASTYFQGHINHQYSRKLIKPSLLKLPTTADELVCL
jgi:myosin VIIa